MKEIQPRAHEEDSRIADVDKAHYMAESARLHANMAALGRKTLRAAEAAENIRTERKVDVYEASGVIAMLEQVTSAGMLTMAEVYFPPLGKMSGAMRGAYRSKLEAWAHQQDVRADHAAEEAARRYDNNDGYPGA